MAADVIGTMGSFVPSLDFGLIGFAFFMLLAGGIGFLYAWKKGWVMNKLKTVALNFEERGSDGTVTLIRDDLCGIEKVHGSIKYHLRGMGRNITPPPLEMIYRMENGKNLVLLNWNDRDEAYAFQPRRFTEQHVYNKAVEAFRTAHQTYEKDADGKDVAVPGKAPQTLDEFREGLRLVEEADMVFFRPALDEGTVNLVMNEMANIKSLYDNDIMSLLKEWAPMIGLVLVVLICIFGFMQIESGLSNIQVVCGGAAPDVAQQVANNLPQLP